MTKMDAARREWERGYLADTLARYDGNVSETARAIGVDRSALSRRLTILRVRDPAMASHRQQVAA